MPQVKRSSSGQNPWLIATIILGIAVILMAAYIILMDGSTATGDNGQMSVISENDASDKLMDFVNEIYGPQIGPVTLKSLVSENGLYKATVTVNDEEGNPVDQVIYISKDGELFVPQVIYIDEAITQFRNLQQQQQLQPTTPNGSATSTDDDTLDVTDGTTDETEDDTSL